MEKAKVWTVCFCRFGKVIVFTWHTWRHEFRKCRIFFLFFQGDTQRKRFTRGVTLWHKTTWTRSGIWQMIRENFPGERVIGRFSGRIFLRTWSESCCDTGKVSCRISLACPGNYYMCQINTVHFNLTNRITKW